MAEIKKRVPIKVPPEMERPIRQIYDDMNDIINAINSFNLSGEEYSGKPGDIRIIKEQQEDYTSKYFIQFKTDDGWVKIEGLLVG